MTSATHSGTRLLLSIVALLCLVGAALAPIGSATLRPVAAQPLCLGETIWDEAQQRCVPIDGVSPSPTPPAPSEPETPSPAPSITLPSPDPAETATITTAEPSADPSAMTDDDTRAAPNQRLTSAQLRVYSCPDDSDWYALADSDPFRLSYEPLCTGTPSTLIPFIISVDGQRVAIPNASNPLSEGMYAQAYDLPAGTYSIVSAPPDGYGTPIVY